MDELSDELELRDIAQSSDAEEPLLYSAGRLIPASHYRCATCGNPIAETVSYVRRDAADALEYHCVHCAKRSLAQAKSCFICNQRISVRDTDSDAVASFGSAHCHRLCMHCKFCSSVSDDQTGYSFVRGSLICHDCIKILNRSREIDKVVIGQFDPELLGEDFDNHCARCGQEFVNNGFIYKGGELVCFNCENIFE